MLKSKHLRICICRKSLNKELCEYNLKHFSLYLKFSCFHVEGENEQEQVEERKGYEMIEIKETEDEIQSEGKNQMLIL